MSDIDLEGLKRRFSTMFHVEDFVPFEVVLAVALESLAIRQSDPIWVMLVCAPSSLKTELIEALARAPSAYPVGKLTPQSLVSGWKATPGSNNGLLDKLQKMNKKLVLIKEFGTILSFQPNARQEILGQLREIFDGHFSANWGTGESYAWHGRLYLLAAVTEAIFEHQESIAALGERFLYLRLPPVNRMEVCRMALAAQEGMENGSLSRAQLAEEASSFLQNLNPSAVVTLPEPGRNALGALADFATRLRSPVPRDRWTREVSRVPTPEGPARLIKGLAAVWCAMARLREADTVRPDDFPACIRLALDSVNPARRQVVRVVYESQDPCSLDEFKSVTGLANSTVRRIADDLASLRVLTESRQGKPHRYELNSDVRHQLDAFLSGVPDKLALVGGPPT